ncbi:hypothetical protein K0M31_005626 [Melipona bicolor]|uniref:Uncharacterized protein n=1 Tax=Melipona bicolor TaxID=60889 RepID=A0AA40FTV4_9HYME|nr:hypothetical protein K0M31_005626 [Melipona bicolor]
MSTTSTQQRCKSHNRRNNYDNKLYCGMYNYFRAIVSDSLTQEHREVMNFTDTRILLFHNAKRLRDCCLGLLLEHRYAERKNAELLRVSFPDVKIELKNPEESISRNWLSLHISFAAFSRQGDTRTYGTERENSFISLIR